MSDRGPYLIERGLCAGQTATYEQACGNMGRLMDDLAAVHQVRQRANLPTFTSAARKDDPAWGEFGFLVSWPQVRHWVQMPGLPLEVVRFPPTGHPRLTVNGSAWVWPFAILSPLSPERDEYSEEPGHPPQPRLERGVYVGEPL